MTALTDVIAERKLEAHDSGSNLLSVTVRVGRPERDPAGGWICPHQILGLGDEMVYGAAGVDSLQALLLAIKMARIHLQTRKDQSLRLDFAGMQDWGMSI